MKKKYLSIFFKDLSTNNHYGPARCIVSLSHLCRAAPSPHNRKPNSKGWLYKWERNLSHLPPRFLYRSLYLQSFVSHHRSSRSVLVPSLAFPSLRSVTVPHPISPEGYHCPIPHLITLGGTIAVAWSPGPLELVFVQTPVF